MFLFRSSPLHCDYCALFLTLGFIFLFFIENPQSHIDTGVRLKLLQKCIQNPLTHLRQSLLRKQLTAENRQLIPQKLHHRCLTDLRIYLCIGTIYNIKRLLGIFVQSVLHPPFVSGKSSLKLLVTFPSSILVQVP